MSISTDTLSLAIYALEREQERLAELQSTNDDEASEYGQQVLDISRALTELRDLLPNS